MSNNKIQNPNALTEGGLPAVLQAVSKLDPYYDLELLSDISYCVGAKLHHWSYDFTKTQRAIWKKALDAGFEPDGLMSHIEIAMVEGFEESR